MRLAMKLTLGDLLRALRATAHQIADELENDIAGKEINPRERRRDEDDVGKR